MANKHTEEMIDMLNDSCTPYCIFDFDRGGVPVSRIVLVTQHYSLDDDGALISRPSLKFYACDTPLLPDGRTMESLLYNDEVRYAADHVEETMHISVDGEDVALYPVGEVQKEDGHLGTVMQTGKQINNNLDLSYAFQTVTSIDPLGNDPWSFGVSGGDPAINGRLENEMWLTVDDHLASVIRNYRGMVSEEVEKSHHQPVENWAFEKAILTFREKCHQNCMVSRPVYDLYRPDPYGPLVVINDKANAEHLAREISGTHVLGVASLDPDDRVPDDTIPGVLACLNIRAVPVQDKKTGDWKLDLAGSRFTGYVPDLQNTDPGPQDCVFTDTSGEMCAFKVWDQIDVRDHRRFPPLDLTATRNAADMAGLSYTFLHTVKVPLESGFRPEITLQNAYILARKMQTVYAEEQRLPDWIRTFQNRCVDVAVQRERNYEMLTRPAEDLSRA